VPLREERSVSDFHTTGSTYRPALQLLVHERSPELVVRRTGRRSGTPFEGRVGHLFTLSDGRVVRFEVFDDPAEALKAVGR
jgi:ketosteroid isomerase-like protein